MNKVSIGIIGCGKISKAYLTSLTGAFADVVEVTACADVLEDAARARAEEFGIARVLSVAELLADDSVRMIANLTNPEAHYELTREALRAGKHVYLEKPLALSMAEGRELVQIARENGLMLSCAPDTLLGGGFQTCRRFLDEGGIGEPVHARASIIMPVSTVRYHRKAVGPTLDMGPYFVAALVGYLGPVKRVSATTLFPEIIARDTQEKHIPEAPSRVAAALEMANGTTASLTMLSAADHYRPNFEIAGYEGFLVCNDPNKFAEGLYLKSHVHGDRDLPVEYALDGQMRGAGLADMAVALNEGRSHRLTGDFALHCLEVLLGVLESGRTGVAVEMQTTCERPLPMSRIDPGQPLSAAFALPAGEVS